MRDLNSDILDAAAALAATHDHAEYLQVAGDVLSRLIPADLTFWTATAFAEGRVTLRGDHLGDRHAALLGRLGPGHPAIASYVADPTDLSPRRISDVVTPSAWRRSQVWVELFAPLAAPHQLSVVLEIAPPSRGVGWTLARSGRDFSEQDVATSRALQPLLLMAERWHAASAPVPARVETEPVGPTAREREVLLLLAQGLTAGAIARRCGITSRTVRKHLQSLYAKLGCSDRLLAVRRAEERHWLPPHPR